jgi:ABC-type transport system substrate-binding protein
MRRLALALLAGTALYGPVRAEGTLTIGAVSDPVTLDPAFFASYFELYAQYLIYEPLLTMTPDLVAVPGLASFTQPDALTYAFTIRPNVTFQDGAAYDADAVKFNLDRMLDPKAGSPRRAELGPIKSIDVTGKLTFTIHMMQPFTQLPLALTNRAGPFKLESWTKNGQLVLDGFDGYYKGKPPLAKVVSALTRRAQLHHGRCVLAGRLISQGNQPENRRCRQDFTGGMSLPFGDGRRGAQLLPHRGEDEEAAGQGLPEQGQRENQANPAIGEDKDTSRHNWVQRRMRL